MPREVVGIVGDTKTMTLQAPPRPTVYVPMTAASGGQSLAWVVNTDATADFAARLRSAIAAIDPIAAMRSE